MGAFVGLLLAGGAALLREYIDNTVKTAEDVESATNLPTLGSVTRFPRFHNPARSLVVASVDRTAVAEAYRVLRANLQFSTFRRPDDVYLQRQSSRGQDHHHG